MTDHDEKEARRAEKENTVHTHADSTTHSHAHSHEYDHDHAQGHPHTHSHEHTKSVLNRLARAIGHLESIKRMVEDGRDCSEVLIQLAAVRSAISSTSRVILEDHINHCLLEAAETGDMEAIEELNKAISYFIK